MKNDKYQRCKIGLWDTTVPGIKFDEDGVSNYYYMFKALEEEFPRGDKGASEWARHLATIKRQGKGKLYDCVIGLSGGTDSCYLLHLAVVEWGLRPLAVYLDNGWSSDVAVKNIKALVQSLDVDLETYVIDYSEVKIALTSYMRASLPWIDGATDRAIKSSLFQVASREGIKSILVGTDFRSEGKQPEEWTHNDARLFSYVTRTFGNGRLKKYPNMSLRRNIFYGAVVGIKRYQPLYFLNYSKSYAKEFLINTYGWLDYGGHHHENLFTKFSIAYWLYQKFNIDKRIITLSAQIISGDVKRDEALEIIKHDPYPKEAINNDLPVVLRKLDLTVEDFEKIWNKKNKTHHDYPSHYKLFTKYTPMLSKLAPLVMPTRPKMLVVNMSRPK